MHPTYDFPNAPGMNPVLYKTVHRNLLEDEKIMGGAFRTDWNLHTMELRDIETLLIWIRALIPDAAYHLGGGAGDENRSGCGFDKTALHIHQCWGIHYNKDQYVISHNHFPYAMSFCYCVTAPEGSSPLIVEDEEIDPVPGRVIFFHAHRYHSTLPNESDGRCMIVGNITYEP